MFTRKIQVVAINDGESLDLKYFSINELPCKRDVEERLLCFLYTVEKLGNN